MTSADDAPHTNRDLLEGLAPPRERAPGLDVDAGDPRQGRQSRELAHRPAPSQPVAPTRDDGAMLLVEREALR